MKFRLTRLLSLILVSTIAFFGWSNSAHSLSVEQGDYWNLITTPNSPPGLAFHALEYDPDRQVTVLFGGNPRNSRENQTWEYNGADWSQVFPPLSPSGRENISHAMAYDTERNRMVLFGGLSVSGVVNDTWEYNGATWSQVNTANAPLARDAHTLVYDASRDKTVLFGGSNPANNFLNDTWEYNGSNWQQVFPAQSPPGRDRHAAAYDSRRGVMVVFGGRGQSGSLNDTWEYDGSSWQRIYPPVSPSGRWNHAMTYDYQRGVVVMFAGTEDGSNRLSDTWEFDGVNWRLVIPTTPPPARMGTSLAYDSLGQKVVMFGGGYYQGILRVFDDTWEYQGEMATNLPIVVEARLDIGMPYDLARGCPSPYLGCGGDYHGFYAGVSADLVMDAYRSGVSLDIQAELSQDHAASPGRYRFGTARYVEDLRRYFSVNQSWYEHAEEYMPGDVVFFDWDGDGVTDHAAIVSNIDPSARPTKMVSAIGFTAENPSGTARELEWNSYFEQHSVGHARLNSAGEPPNVTATETGQSLRVWLDSPSISLKLMDDLGKVAGENYNENLVASNVKDYIPYIPGGQYVDLGAQKTITVTNPMLGHPDQYHVEMTTQASQTFHLRLETLQDGAITDSRVYTTTVQSGKTYRLDFSLELAPTLKIKIADPALQDSPQLGIPSLLHLSGLVGTTVQQIFSLEEIGGFGDVSAVDISSTNLYNQLGEWISASQLTIIPNGFTIPAEGTQQVTLQVNLVGAKPGWYHGSLLLEPGNCNPVSIPLTVVVEPYKRFIPMVYH